MRSPNRDTSVFSTSAIDLFASALDAFILLVIILFPYYRNAGSADSWAEVEDLMQQRRLVRGEIGNLLAPLRRRPAHPPGHLRQGGQLRRVHRHTG